MNIDLKGKNALVCGASRGIGRAVAVALAELGARVTALARDAGRLDETIAKLSVAAGQRHDKIVADMTDAAGLEALAAGLLERHGQVEILVNNSGGPPPGPAHGVAPEAFVAAFRQHLVAAQVLTNALGPKMRAAGYGRVINIISTSVKEPIAGLGVSNTIRGAVASWAKTLATELGPAGITVNNVLPGFTDTERLAQIFATRAERSGDSPEAIKQQALAKVPAGRLAAPEEIAAAVAFLASPAAGYVNGINLPVDGGRTGAL